MAASYFLSVSDASSLTPVEWDGRPVVQQYDRLAARLERDVPELAGLFAEPVTGNRQNAAPQVSWYTRHEGPVVPFSDVPAAERDAAAASVAGALGRLKPLLADPEIGPFLGYCLVIPRLDDVVLVAGNPVLRNWGMVAAGTGTDGDALARAFNGTLGRFAAYPELPWRMVPPPPPIAPAAPAAAAAAAEAAPLLAEAPPPLLDTRPPRPPWWRRPGPALAVMAALLVIVGLLSFVVAEARTPKLTDAESKEKAALAANRPILDERLQAFRAATGAKICTPAGADTEAIGEDAARHHLENGVGWLLGRAGTRPMRGGAFFIAPDLMVTRRSAIADTDPHGLVAVFPALGGSFPVEIVAQTAAGEERNGRDFAVLKLRQPKGNLDVLTLSPTAAAGTAVYAASYPTYFDPDNLSEMLEGSISTAPQLDMTSGVAERVEGQALHHSAAVWKGSAGTPLLDACGRVVGVPGATGDAAGTLSVAPLIEFLKSAKIAFAENDQACLAKPILAKPTLANAAPAATKPAQP
jgi:hypothetical protein